MRISLAVLIIGLSPGISHAQEAKPLALALTEVFTKAGQCDYVMVKTDLENMRTEVSGSASAEKFLEKWSQNKHYQRVLASLTGEVANALLPGPLAFGPVFEIHELKLKLEQEDGFPSWLEVRIKYWRLIEAWWKPWPGTHHEQYTFFFACPAVR